MFRAFATAALALTLCAAAPEYTQLYAFGGKPDGAYPGGGLAIDRAGNLYGLTEQGGSDDNGAIFELSPPHAGQMQWTERVLLSIPTADGYDHAGGVAFWGAHTLVATSVAGGTQGCGAILAATISGKPALQMLHEFAGGPGDGCHPTSTPALGRYGTLVGVTGTGGAHGLGSVYSLAPVPSQAKSELDWSFAGPDGSQPGGPPLLAPNGSFYGTDYNGGSAGLGTVWGLTLQLAPPLSQSHQILWQFRGAPDCAAPAPGILARDGHGNLFGACQAGGGFGYGGFFELSPPAILQGAWTERVIADSNADIGIITSSPVFDRAGRLIATSYGLTDGRARVIALVPPPAGQRNTVTTVWVFPPSIATSPVLVGPTGALFGTTATGGAAGTVWSLKLD